MAAGHRVMGLRCLALVSIDPVPTTVPTAVLGIRSWAADRRHGLPTVGQPTASTAERGGHGVRLEQVQPRPGAGDLLPDPVGEGLQSGTERSGDDENIGIGWAGRGRPPPLPQLPFHGEPDAGAARHFDQQHVRAVRGDPQQQTGQTHRNAPSRHA
jgi:hypothetical protein